VVIVLLAPVNCDLRFRDLRPPFCCHTFASRRKKTVSEVCAHSEVPALQN
jgi:hypothetical protein